MTNEEAAGRIAWLELQVAAQERISMAIALTLPKSKRAELVENLTSLQINAAGMEGRDAGRAMQHFIDRFLALAGDNLADSGAQARLSLVLEAALQASVPPDLREAQRSWLAIASPDEIAEETRALLAKLPPMPAALKRKRRAGPS